MTVTDEGRASAPGVPGDGDDPAPPVGSVAEEAARLVELLAATGTWGRAGQATHGTHRTTSERPDDDRSDGGTPGTQGHSCTCGGVTPQACRLCPVCQVIAFVGSISPETIERAADLVGFAATALRDLASAQRSRQSTASGAGHTEERTEGCAEEDAGEPAP